MQQHDGRLETGALSLQPCVAGLENYTCVEFALRSYATNVEGPASFFTADSLFVVTSQSERFYAQVRAEQGKGQAAQGCSCATGDFTPTLSPGKKEAC